MSSHEHDHDHGHSHNHAPQSLSALVGVLTLTSVVFLAELIAGIVIRFTGFQAADTIASVIIAALILPRSVQLLLAALRVLLEQVPAGVDLDAVHAALVAVPGVEEVHDLHVWSVDGTDLLASAHIVVSETPAELAECSLLDAATAALADHGIKHSTIQLESSAHAEHEEINH